MPTDDWNERYIRGDLPWDSDEPDPHLVEIVRARLVTPGRTLDVGCGTGTNAVWLAEHGFEVLGIDVAPRAVELANARAAAARGRCRFEVLDFLVDALPETSFDFVFDRGVFHVFDAPARRALFAERVAEALHPDGLWLSLIGSTEGPSREHGPPRRSARDIANAVEPALEITLLRSTEFHADLPSTAKAWMCVAKHRSTPAQPSTGSD